MLALCTLTLGLLAGCAGTAAPVPAANAMLFADPNAFSDVERPRLAVLSEDAAAPGKSIACTVLGDFWLAPIQAAPERRTPADYQALERGAALNVWQRWAMGRASGPQPPPPTPVPDAVRLRDVPSFDQFVQQGRWQGQASLLSCGGVPADELLAGPVIVPPLATPVSPDFGRVVPRLSYLEPLDAPRRAISAALDRAATRIDEFFADEPVRYHRTGTYVKLTFDTVFQEGGEIGYGGDVRVRLSLPRTQEKWLFLFETDPDQPAELARPTLEQTPSQAVTQHSYFAGLQVVLGSPGDWRFRPSIGVSLATPQDVFVRFRVDRAQQFGDWLVRPSETVFWFDSIGWGEQTTLVLDYRLARDWLFRSDSNARWTRQAELFELGQVLSLFQTLDEIRGLAYQASVFGVSKPAQIANEYVLAVTYRQTIHSDYVFMELIPQVRFRREAQFTDEAAFDLRFEILFGK